MSQAAEHTKDRTASGRQRKIPEKRFVEEFNELVELNELERALELLIEYLPTLSEGKMNKKEKLKHLTFAGRRLQHAGLGKYGIAKTQRKVKAVTAIAEKYGLPDKNLFVDFGCGTHEPLALATYFYGNGFKKCIANDFLPVKSPEYAALSMYDIVSYMLLFPEEFAALGQAPHSFAERLKCIDLKQLFAGNFDAGMAPLGEDVMFKSCDVRESGIGKSSVSFLISFAVFEHVMEIDKVCRFLFEAGEPGGLQHHFIDLADHRAHRHDGSFNKFHFLTEEEAPPNLNRLRASEHLAAFEAAGFEILNMQGNRESVPEETRAKLLPKWAQMSAEDQETVSMSITLRKPG